MSGFNLRTCSSLVISFSWLSRKVLITDFGNEDNLTSFASKFCGHHNQNSPFWDNQVSVFVKYLNYRHRYRNYREYVESIIALRNDYNLVDYSLREIEYAMWEITDDVINGRFLH